MQSDSPEAALRKDSVCLNKRQSEAMLLLSDTELAVEATDRRAKMAMKPNELSARVCNRGQSRQAERV